MEKLKKLKEKFFLFFGTDIEVSRWFELHGNQSIEEIVWKMEEDELNEAYHFFLTRPTVEARLAELSDMNGYNFIDARVIGCIYSIQARIARLHEKK